MSSTSQSPWQLRRHSETGRWFYFNTVTRQTAPYTPPVPGTDGSSRHLQTPRTSHAHSLSQSSTYSGNSGDEPNYSLTQQTQPPSVQQQPLTALRDNSIVDGNVLDSRFQVKTNPRQYYKRGRVFLVLWSEPLGNTSGRTSSEITPGIYGQNVFSRIRRFVVIREGPMACAALPIMTYGRRGVSKPGVNKAEHAIIYTGVQPPEPMAVEAPGYNEHGMQPYPIRVNPDVNGEKLDVRSRLDLAGVHTIQHNLKVRGFGMVVNVNHLVAQFQAVWSNQEATAPSETGVTPTTQANLRQHNLQEQAMRDRSNVSYGHSSVLSGPSSQLPTIEQVDNEGNNVVDAPSQPRAEDHDEDAEGNGDDGGNGNSEFNTFRTQIIYYLISTGWTEDHAATEANCALQARSTYSQLLQNGYSPTQAVEYLTNGLRRSASVMSNEAAQARILDRLRYGTAHST